MSTPKMTSGTVEMVPVEWIMQNTTSSVDGFQDYISNGVYGVDYEALVRSKATDCGFGHLVNTIMTEGFRIPIVLVKDFLPYDYDEDDEESYDENFFSLNRLVHGNGHHRMACAILLGLDKIPVYWSEGEEYMCEGTSEGEAVRASDETWDDFEDWLEEVFYENG